MRFLCLVRRHPAVCFGVLTVAFILWVWRDSLRTNLPRSVGPPVPELTGRKAVLRADGDGPPRWVPIRVNDTENGDRDPRDTAQMLSKLKPGMMRTEVEGLVGAPVPTDVHPATIAGNLVTYQTSYEADLQPPPTVRPTHRPRLLRPNPDLKGHSTVMLEFDATKPGHPLLGIHYPDPLF